MGLKRQRPGRYIFLVYFLASLVSVSLVSQAGAEEVAGFCGQKMLSHLMVDMFLQKVDQGEVFVFEHKLSRADLQPCKVAYIHDTADDSLSIHLYFKLKKKILFPDSEDLYVKGITVMTDEDGTITRINMFDVFPFDVNDPK